MEKFEIFLKRLKEESLETQNVFFNIIMLYDISRNKEKLPDYYSGLAKNDLYVLESFAVNDISIKQTEFQLQIILITELIIR